METQNAAANSKIDFLCSEQFVRGARFIDGGCIEYGD
jgi:hypothetical protein